MNLHSGFIAIKNGKAEDLSRIFSKFKLIDTKKDSLVFSFKEVSQIIEKEIQFSNDFIQKRIIWFENDWLIIEDLSLILCTDKKAINNISLELNTEVFSITTQGTSDTFIFSHVENNSIRNFMYSAGEIIEDSGKKIKEENEIPLDEDISYETIHSLSKQFGVNWENKNNVTEFIVKTLENSPELNEEINQVVQKMTSKNEKNATKPWWKFW